METNETRAGIMNKRVYIGVIVALLLINGITLYFLFAENRGKMDVTSQKMALENNFRDISDTLDAKKTELEQFRGQNAELDKQIDQQQAMIDEQKRQISSLLSKGNATAGELKKARGLIAQYETNIADMGRQVAELNKQNVQLTAQNTQLNTDLTTERQTTFTLTEQNMGLSKKVEVGSLLSIAKVNVEAVKRRNNGKEVPVSKVKSAESLKISFETGQNRVLDPGPVSLYVRIINPKGETIAVADQGSGTIQCEESAEPCQFTKKADINWDQTSKKVVVYWGQNIKDPGTYRVQVYQSGHVVGKGEIKLS